MSEFDKWWEENYMILSSDRTEAEYIYNLGVESQQAKIDEMQEQIRIEREQGTEYFTDTHSLISERDELQERIDKALERMDAESSNSWGLWKEKADMYEQGASAAYEKSYWILKGNKDEN